MYAIRSYYDGARVDVLGIAAVARALRLDRATGREVDALRPGA